MACERVVVGVRNIRHISVSYVSPEKAIGIMLGGIQPYRLGTISVV